MNKPTGHKGAGKWRLALLGLAATLCVPATQARLPGFVSPLPPEIIQTLSKHFHGGKVTGFSRERQRGMWVFEVRVRKNRKQWEATVTRDGGLLETEQVVRLQDLPPMVIQVIRTKLRPTRVLRVERHERYGVIRATKYRALDKPRISYEISYIGPDARRHERQIRSNGVMELPAPVIATLRSRFNGWAIHEAEMDSDGRVNLYTVELRGPAKPHQSLEVVLDANGKILSVESIVPYNALPQAAAAIVQKDRAFRRKHKPDLDIRRRDVYARVEKGAVVPYRDVSYSVTLIADKKMRQYDFDARGRLLSRTKWEPAPEVEGEHDNDAD